MNKQERKNYTTLSSWFKHNDLKNLKRGEVIIKEPFDGRYQIDEVLGYGHTSIVFKAFDKRKSRTVALKMWQHSDCGIDPAVIMNEGKLLKKLHHSNIVKAFDFGIYKPENRPWISLEYLGTMTMRDLIKKDGPFSGNWHRLINIGIQIADIVESLHSTTGIFHLDLKPCNLSCNVEDDTVKLIDLGSAYVTSGQCRERYGTPGYIAPELFNSAPFTISCDMFSLGMVLYEMITGHNPLVKHQTEALNLKPEQDTSSEIIYLCKEYITHDQTDEIPVTVSIPINGNGKKRSSQISRNYTSLLDKMRTDQYATDLNHLNTPTNLISLIDSMIRFDSNQRPSAHYVHMTLRTMLDRPKDSSPDNKTSPRVSR